ncbi:hypothetical protein OnM2_071063, partial [Erysiphe neolycopersici]
MVFQQFAKDTTDGQNMFIKRDIYIQILRVRQNDVMYKLPIHNKNAVRKFITFFNLPT